MSPRDDFDLRGVIGNSLLEWEDHLSLVVIAGGCNLRCPYCHSWRYVTGLDGLERIDPEVVFRLLERQSEWIDGVVFTGGEPTLQPGLAGMIRRVREFGARVKLHTNGSRPDVVSALLADGLLDCLALDYKAPLDGEFYAEAGVSGAVRETFGLAASAASASGGGIGREYHTTLHPRFADADILRRMGGELEPGGLWILQQYEPGDVLDPVKAGGERYGGAELDALFDVARALHQNVLLKKGSS